MTNERLTYLYWTERISGGSVIPVTKALLETVDIALASEKKERETCAKTLHSYFTEHLGEQKWLARITGKPIVDSGVLGAITFLASHAPAYTSPVRYLREMREFAETMLRDLSEADGEIIKPERVEEILSFLDTTYGFSKLVFGGAPVISIINAHYQGYDGNYFFWVDGTGALHKDITLCPVFGQAPGETPEYILFHELGHALHASITGDIGVVPDCFTRMLPMFPTFGELPTDDQAEILADVFAMGLMTGSPYEDLICGTWKKAVAAEDFAWFHRMAAAAITTLQQQKESCA